IIEVQCFRDFVMRLDPNKFALAQAELRLRGWRTLGYAKWPQRVWTAADGSLEGVIDPAHCRTDSQTCFSNGSPQEVHKARGQPVQAHVTRGVILDVLAHIPRFQRFRRELDLRVLAHIGWLAFSGGRRNLDG